jgi:hypothetical protein
MDDVRKQRLAATRRRSARSTSGSSGAARQHDEPEIERVVYRHDRYWVVQKL